MPMTGDYGMNFRLRQFRCYLNSLPIIHVRKMQLL
jgi:hypothetical protein